MLYARRALFDGRWVIGVVTDQHTESFAQVQHELRWKRDIIFVNKPNDPDRREVQTWNEMWAHVPTDDDSVTFYCHAKGATRGEQIVQWWTDIAWHILCDYPDLVDEALRRRPVVGIFKREGFTPGYPWPCAWHFSGSFYWVKSRQAPRSIDPHGWGVETWPGRHFKEEDACCLFMEKTVSCYDQKYWDFAVTPAFQYWRAALRFVGLSTTDCSTTEWSALPHITFPPLTGTDGSGTIVLGSRNSRRIGDFLTHACNCSPR
jgi:hypothetical protein